MEDEVLEVSQFCFRLFIRQRSNLALVLPVMLPRYGMLCHISSIF